MSKKNINQIPSVLAFEKKLVPSDGYMYGTVWDKRKTDSATRLSINIKSVRGVTSHRTNKEAETKKANLQRVDHCALGENMDTLKLTFTLKILGDIGTPSACNNKDYLGVHKARVKRYTEKHQFTELAKRYATNIANARFLWRNRVGAEEIEIEVKDLNRVDNTWNFNALDFSCRDFNHNNKDVADLAGKISEVFRGEKSHLLLEIIAYAKVGKSQDIYPSEELVLDTDNKSKVNDENKKSKILYKVDGGAAMHSQKIGNALRTIDTWYNDYIETSMPIAIEPYGSVTNLGIAYRGQKGERSFYELHDNLWATDKDIKEEQDEHYIMAMLIRGGVFSKKDKTDKSSESTDKSEEE